MADQTLRIIRFDQDEEMDSNEVELEENSLTSSDPPSPERSKLHEDKFSSTPESNDESKQLYESFIAWEKSKKPGPITETVLKDYFTELSSEIKPAVLWKYYYAIKNGLRQHKTQHIETYTKLHELLGPHPRKLWSSTAFSLEELNLFLKHAPNNPYLPTKTALILGLMGSLKARQLYDLQICNIVFGSTLIVNIPKTAHYPSKMFRVTFELYKRICRKYVAARPNGAHVYVFHQYRNNEVLPHRLGARSFKSIAENVMAFLNIDTADDSGQSDFLKTPAVLAIDENGNFKALKSFGRGPCRIVEPARMVSSTPRSSLIERPREERSITASTPVIQKVESIAGKTINVELTRNESEHVLPNNAPIKLINCKDCKFTIVINNYRRSPS